jgi:hypothetical protein
MPSNSYNALNVGDSCSWPYSSRKTRAEKHEFLSSAKVVGLHTWPEYEKDRAKQFRWLLLPPPAPYCVCFAPCEKCTPPIYCTRFYYSGWYGKSPVTAASNRGNRCTRASVRLCVMRSYTPLLWAGIPYICVNELYKFTFICLIYLVYFPLLYLCYHIAAILAKGLNRAL